MFRYERLLRHTELLDILVTNESVSEAANEKGWAAHHTVLPKERPEPVICSTYGGGVEASAKAGLNLSGVVHIGVQGWA